MLLSIHKEKTDEINLKNVANVFSEANEERRHTFRYILLYRLFTVKRSKFTYFQKTTY